MDKFNVQYMCDMSSVLRHLYSVLLIVTSPTSTPQILRLREEGKQRMREQEELLRQQLQNKSNYCGNFVEWR